MAIVDAAERSDSTNEGRVPLMPGATSVHLPNRRLRVPLSIPTEQEYYWRFEWQSEEREALAELDAGEAYRFDSDDPEDAARFLDDTDLDPDED